jgi:hypothetical protein
VAVLKRIWLRDAIADFIIMENKTLGKYKLFNFGCILVFLCFHVLLVVYFSKINFSLFSLKLYNLQKHENTKLRPKHSLRWKCVHFWECAHRRPSLKVFSISPNLYNFQNFHNQCNACHGKSQLYLFYHLFCHRYFSQPLLYTFLRSAVLDLKLV